MFENLTNRLSTIVERLKGKATLREEDVNDAMREIRVALLEADVALPVVKDFIEAIRANAVGQEVIKSVDAAQMIVKIVHDHLVEALGEESKGLDLQATPPVSILLVGLQGAGKTTLAAKLALRLKNKQRKKVLMVSLDVRRPAAQHQLAVLGEQADVSTLPIIEGQQPADITKRALEIGRKEGFDVILLDTAGRLHIDTELMEEVSTIQRIAQPRETLLVADSMTGQDAVNVAKEFNDQVPLSGIVLTRVDGDARGGAALSMRHITGRPIKFLSTGEKLADLEEFHPERVASRILDMGDIVSLVERAAEVIDEKEAEKFAKKLEKGRFDFEDLASQLKQVSKIGNFKGMMGMLPGMGKFKEKIEAAEIDEKVIPRQIAIISSMTPKERKYPKLLNPSRKKRIAAGSGTAVPEINKLIKQLEKASKMMKKVKKLGKKGLLDENLFTQ
jgi:signal recognition particle subunit SRP54